MVKWHDRTVISFDALSACDINNNNNSNKKKKNKK